MSFDDKKYLEFLDAQVALLDAVNKVITENAIAFHRDTCPDPDDECTLSFVAIFVEHFKQTLKQKEKLSKRLN